MPLSGVKIAAWFADWSGRRLLEEEIFGAGDPERIAAIVDRFCVRSLGSPIERYEFFASSVLSVHGVRLSDGRRVVIKAARRSFGPAFLGAVQTVQSHLAASGFPCPSPLLGPAALERGICVVEELLDAGVPADAHQPCVRREMASALARQIELSRRFGSLDGLGPSLLASPSAGELRPEPHDMRFDFGASARGAEWIDDLATAARERLADTVGEIVVAHSDWRAEHVRFARHKIVATYDWQSLAVGSEPVLLGQIGHGFTADWNIDQARRTPTIEEFRAFITDYESARGQRFSQAERNTIEPPGSTQPPTARVANIQTSSSGCPGRPPTPATTATAACSPVMDGSCSNEATAWREVPRRRASPLGNPESRRSPIRESAGPAGSLHPGAHPLVKR